MSEHRAHYLTVRGNYGRGYPSRQLQYQSTCDCGWVGDLLDDPTESARQYSRHVACPHEINAAIMDRLEGENRRLNNEVERLKALLKSIETATQMRSQS